MINYLKSFFHPIRVSHGYNPKLVGGPFVKLERMNKYFPNWDKYYNIIYSVSGCDYPLDRIKRAKERGVKIVCHCNSCWHPAYAENWKQLNSFLEITHNDLADFIVYGSEQARLGASLYLGKSTAPWEMIYNAVDTDFFIPIERSGRKEVRILAAGLQNIRHRLEPLIRAMPAIQKSIPKAKLVIAGKIKSCGAGDWDCSEDWVRSMIAEVSSQNPEFGIHNVEFIPQYKQAEAPSIYQNADVLVHLKHMDWTPNVVAEAMACGLPIVHTGNGGVPEIVGDAGVSLGVAADWDKIQVPSPERVAEGVIEAIVKRDVFGKRAREIAVEKFQMKDWAARHQRIFERLLNT